MALPLSLTRFSAAIRNIMTSRAFLVWLNIIFVISIFAKPAKAASNSFQILVDTNQITQTEASQASKFTADGLWTIPVNSPGINWAKMFQDVQAAKWTVSEDNPTATTGVYQVSQTLNRLPDGVFMYNEWNNGFDTLLTDEQIINYSSHVVPGFGPIGNRLIVHTRSFGVTDPRRTQLIHALTSPRVSGATFEFNPDTYTADLKLEDGCKYVLSLGKKCYLLMPPSSTTTNYVADIQRAVSNFAAAGVLNDPNIYVVPAVYVREQNQTHFISTSDSDVNSIEAVVKWLKDYRNQKPIGFQDGVNGNACSTGGWALDQDAPGSQLQLHIYVDGPYAGGGTFLGTYSTNILRPDVNSSQNATGTHGFNITFSPSISAEQILFNHLPHSLYIYALDSENKNSNNILLANSPTTITCTSGNPADISGPSGIPDNVVDAYDYTPIATDYGKSGAPGFSIADITGKDGVPDGTVSMYDYSFFVNNFGK